MGRIYHKVILSQTRRRRPFLGPGGVGGGGRGCFILTSFLYGPSQLGRSESRLVRGQTESWYLKEYNGTNPTQHTNPPSVNKLIDASLVSKFQIIHIQ